MSKFIKELGCTESTLAEILQEPFNTPAIKVMLYYDNDWYISHTDLNDNSNLFEIRLELYLESFVEQCDTELNLGCDIDTILNVLKRDSIVIDNECFEALALFYDNGEYYIHAYWEEQRIFRVKEHRKVWW